MKTLLLLRLAGVSMLSMAIGAGAVFGQELHPFADSTRLVSIGGSLTEIIFALGEEGRLVARDQTALHPQAALALPDVGYMRQLSPEGVLSVSPTALLVVEGSGPPEALEVLSQVGVDYQTVPESYSAEGVLLKVRAVGQALDKAEKASALETELAEKFAALANRTAAIARPKRVLFVLSTDGGKIQASGTGTAADGIIMLAGGVNAIDQYSGYKALTEEAIIEAAPDAVLMMDRGGPGGATEAELLANPAIALTPAGRSGAVFRLEGSFLLGFGPRTPDAASALADLLYGKR